MSDEHPDVIVPHDRRDLKRVSLVIMAASIPLFVTAWRFGFLGDTDQDLHAAWAFAFGGAWLLVTGAVIGLRLPRRT